jgi:predicted phosphodiesterase
MRLGLLSDAHGHAAALRQGLALLRARGADHIIFLGDAVGYIPSIEALAVLAAESDIVCLRGNHEEMMLRGGSSSENEAVYQLARVRAALDANALAVVESWPARVDLPLVGGTLRLVHGSPAEPTFGYVQPDTPLEPFGARAGDIWVCANTHRPFRREAGGAIFVNTGSCGLPRDDGRYGCVCLLNPATGAAEFLRYDIAASLAECLRAWAPVHASVAALADRRADRLVGEVVA